MAGSNITDQIIAEAGRELADEIDREILWGMLTQMGWHRVMIPSDTAMLQATEIKEWIALHCTGNYEKHRSDFLFENDRDATMFILRWA